MLLPALLLALCGACAAPTPQRAAGGAVAAGADLSAQAVYLAPDRVDAIALIGPPPAAGSSAQQADLDAVLAAQRAARGDAARMERALGDTQFDCARVADVLVASGPGRSAAAAGGSPASGDAATAIAFATRAAEQASEGTEAPKRHWARARPYVVSEAVQRFGDVAPDSPAAMDAHSNRDHRSYPSGHTALGTACAIVLAQMVPEQRAALFARALAYGESRIIVGAHFPSDVEAGRLIGTAAAAVMLQDERYQRDLRLARAQLRRALGLPAADAAAR